VFTGSEIREIKFSSKNFYIRTVAVCSVLKITHPANVILRYVHMAYGVYCAPFVIWWGGGVAVVFFWL